MSSSTEEDKAVIEINEETESEKEVQATTSTSSSASTCEGNTSAAAVDVDVAATEGAFNPQVSSDDEDNLERVRGDAIGSTLYSQRYVLSILLKLTKLQVDEGDGDEGEARKKQKLLADDEEFEKELCALWDMTIEEDVVLLLLEHNVLELFVQCIDATEDKRLTEILVGVMGNMCSVRDARSTLSANAEVMTTLLGLIGCSDTLTLIQLMRLLSALLVHAETDAETWFLHFCNARHFVPDLCFLLSNSMNETLLAHALEALNAILAKFALILPPSTATPPVELQPQSQPAASTEKQNDEDKAASPSTSSSTPLSKLSSFSDIFVKEALISSTAEAFQTLTPKRQLPTQSARKTMQIFLNIHCILTQYDEESRACYAKHMPQVVDCLVRILEPLCDPLYLLPLSTYDQEMLENVNDIFLAFGDPFDARCICQMITIWNHIAEEMEERAHRSPGANDFELTEDELEEGEICYEDFCLTILDFITRTVRQADEAALQQVLRNHTTTTVLQLLDALGAGDSEADIKECCSKIKTAFDKLSTTEESSVNDNLNQ